MERAEIAMKTKKIICEILDESPIKLNSRFKEDLDGDSLDKLDVVMECEKEFNISIEDKLLDHELNTVEDFVNVIESKL